MRRRLAEASCLLNADGTQHNTALRPIGMMKFLGQDNMPQARGKDPVCPLIQRCLQTEEPREEALLLAVFLSLLLLLVLIGLLLLGGLDHRNCSCRGVLGLRCGWAGT